MPKPYVSQCEECHANLTEIHIINGEEESWLCSACAGDLIFGMVIGTLNTAFLSPVEKEHNCTRIIVE